MNLSTCTYVYTGTYCDNAIFFTTVQSSIYVRMYLTRYVCVVWIISSGHLFFYVLFLKYVTEPRGTRREMENGTVKVVATGFFNTVHSTVRYRTTFMFDEQNYGTEHKHNNIMINGTTVLYYV